jgi:tetratricopeptide (TPR) repeat protein
MFQAALATASVESELAFHQGVAAYGEGRLDEARARFERVVEEAPDDAAALQYLNLIALAQGRDQDAVDFASRAHAADPESRDIRLDLGIALLNTGQLDEAATHFDFLLAADSRDAEAHLYRGIIDYRQGDFQNAVGHFDAAEANDPALKLQTRYYVALSEASVGNNSASAGAFSDVIEQSPQHPLGRSARSLRDRIPEEERIWSVYATAGVEVDTNPTVLGDDTFANVDKNEDVAGIFRAGGQVQAFEHESTRLNVGYDGYLSVYSDETDVSQQTHVGWTSASYDMNPVRFGVRYDFAYTALDLDDSFRLLHRLTPSISLRSEKWGITRFAYEFQYFDFDDDFSDNISGDAFDRSGPQHSIGLDQFFVLPEPFSFGQLGARATTFNSDGEEFDHQGFEIVAGGGVDLIWDTELRLQYRFQYRDYDGETPVSPGDPTSREKAREDEVHRLTVDLIIPILAYLDLSIAGSFTFNDSTVNFYEYDRQIVGTYLTARF